MSERVALRSLRPRERCEINGYACEVERQAGRSTYVRVLDDRLPGRPVVQLSKRLPNGQPRTVAAVPTPTTPETKIPTRTPHE